MRKTFPKEFLWGASISAFQVEGAAFEDGKTENLDDYFRRHPEEGSRYEGDRLPDVCADFYHKYPEDIQRFKELGLNAFRFSISWPRIFPDGPEKVNPKGIAYYNDMIDKLLEAGITPMFDLLHCDPPIWAYKRGYFANREFIDWYVTYAKTCFEAFGDRVKLWSTLNEPKLNVYGSYSFAFAPPYLEDERLAMEATRNMIIAHFKAVKVLREMWPDAKIGSVHNMGVTYSYSFDEKDILAAERHDAMQLLFAEPMITGKYPELMRECEEFMRYVTEEDERELAENFVPMDFLGLNCYCPTFSKYSPDEQYGVKCFIPDLPSDGYGCFYTHPQGLFDTLLELKDMFPEMPLIITENGYTYRRSEDDLDTPTTSQDKERVSYIREHVREAWRAMQAGVNLKGYFYWAALDCYEGSMGFGVDMGLIGINYKTLERTKRDSFYYYKEIVTRGEVD